MWSISKLKKLQRLYPTMDDELIAEELNMGVSQIRKKAAELGLEKSQELSTHWTALEEAWVRSHFLYTDTVTMARLLGKDVGDVANKCKELGLVRYDRGWSDAQLNLTRALYPAFPTKRVAEKVKKSPMEVEHMAFRMGLRKDRTFYSNLDQTPEEVEFVKEASERYNAGLNCSRGHYVLGQIIGYLYPIFDRTEEYPIEELRLDWYMPELKLGFEFDGVQHTEYSQFFHGSRAEFERAKERDYRKSMLCEDMGIAIVRVAHDEKLTIALVRAKVEEVI